jgi:hypothetical protein
LVFDAAGRSTMQVDSIVFFFPRLSVEWAPDKDSNREW